VTGPPVGGATVVVSVAQLDLRLGEVDENLASCLAAIDHARGDGAALVVLPECALSGYVFNDRGAAERAAITLDGPEVGEVAKACAAARLHCVVGLLEHRGGDLFNTAILIDDRGELLGAYRKLHLPVLGVDRFVTPGSEPPPAFDTRLGRIGLSICFDIRFPEAARVLALEGTELIAHPANWPAQARSLAEHFAVVRAAENRVFIAAANRGDSEAGTDFAGLSRIVDPDGVILATTGRGAAVLSAKVDLALARTKSFVRVPGAYEADLWGQRRPRMYAALTESAPAQEPERGE
jgi:5-aminopentanamidase